MDTKKLIEEFISNSKSFYKDLELDSIDSKHQSILEGAYKQFDLEKDDLSYRSWKGQTDLDVPAQFSINYLKNQKFPRSILKYFYRKFFKRMDDYFLKNLINDEIDIIQTLDGNELLQDNPVHLTPAAFDVYNINKTSVNIRWLRYIYILNRILKDEMLPDNGTWVDIGSYYGGVQGLVRKYKPQSKIVMVDFNHQLCRSYIYLSKLYPNSKHVLPDSAVKYENLESIDEGSFVYIPVSLYRHIDNDQVDLVSNFFSLGEMNRIFFNEYFNSNLLLNSKKNYLVNRMVSSPFFEKTYDSDISILDYIKDNRKVDYFDIFPMAHYLITKRLLFGRNSFRNISSSYFELITSKTNK